MEPVPYRADYLVSRKGKVVGSMQVSLEKVGDNTFVYRMDTRVDRGMVHPHIVQQSEFTWKNGVVLPDDFRSTQKVAFYRRTEFVEFDWVNMKASGRKKRDDFEMDIHSGMQDKLTIYLLLARELCRGRYPINADVVSGPVLKPYHYQLQTQEVLDTKLGALQTTHIRRGSPDTEKQTDLWHARETGFLPVKMVYRNKDDINTMSLNEISFSTGLE